jgi:drug/metabolite transporter (DMT)-like permease
MNDRLTFAQITLLLAYAAGMAAGQILFKLAAVRAGAGLSVERVVGLFGNGFFLAALVLYAVLAILWVWILTFTPLSRAYPFVAVAFAVTPLLGALVFAEPFSARLLVGIAVVFCGLLLIAS